MNDQSPSVSQDDPSGGLPRNFPRPCLLLLIGEQPSHGYDLLERMGRLGVHGIDPGGLYRALRMLERDALATSRWETSSNGPPRRVYALTRSGWAMLRAWATTLAETHAVLSTYLDRYGELATIAPEVPYRGPAGLASPSGRNTVPDHGNGDPAARTVAPMDASRVMKA